MGQNRSGRRGRMELPGFSQVRAVLFICRDKKLTFAYRYLLKFENYNPHPDFPAVDLKERASVSISRRSA